MSSSAIPSCTRTDVYHPGNAAVTWKAEPLPCRNGDWNVVSVRM